MSIRCENTKEKFSKDNQNSEGCWEGTWSSEQFWSYQESKCIPLRSFIDSQLSEEWIQSIQRSVSIDLTAQFNQNSTWAPPSHVMLFFFPRTTWLADSSPLPSKTSTHHWSRYHIQDQEQENLIQRVKRRRYPRNRELKDAWRLEKVWKEKGKEDRMRRSRRIVEDWLSVELIDLMMISVLSCLLIRGGFEERQGGRVLLSLKGFLS